MRERARRAVPLLKKNARKENARALESEHWRSFVLRHYVGTGPSVLRVRAPGVQKNVRMVTPSIGERWRVAAWGAG